MEFNIIDYVKGLTAYQFDDNVYKRIIMDRAVSSVTDFNYLSKKDIDLLTADLMYVAYSAPTTMASVSQSHNGFSQTYGTQTVSERNTLYNMVYSIYKKYEDPKINELEKVNGTIEFINESYYEDY